MQERDRDRLVAVNMVRVPLLERQQTFIRRLTTHAVQLEKPRLGAESWRPPFLETSTCPGHSAKRVFKVRLRSVRRETFPILKDQKELVDKNLREPGYLH